FLDSSSFLENPDMVEELIMATLEARAASASGLRSAVEGAVRTAYGSLPGTWDFKTGERLAKVCAMQSALVQLEGNLSADHMGDLYHAARAMLTTPDYAILVHADSKWRTEWVDRLAKTMELDAANRPVLDAAVDEMQARLGKFQGQFGADAKTAFNYSI